MQWKKISVKEKYAKVSKPSNYASENWSMINISWNVKRIIF
jgi:hypothetical protein